MKIDRVKIESTWLDIASLNNRIKENVLIYEAIGTNVEAIEDTEYYKFLAVTQRNAAEMMANDIVRVLDTGYRKDGKKKDNKPLSAYIGISNLKELEATDINKCSDKFKELYGYFPLDDPSCILQTFRNKLDEYKSEYETLKGVRDTVIAHMEYQNDKRVFKGVSLNKYLEIYKTINDICYFANYLYLDCYSDIGDSSELFMFESSTKGAVEKLCTP